MLFFSIIFLFITSAVFAQETITDDRIIVADSLYEDGHYEEAILKYREFIASPEGDRQGRKKAVSECYASAGLCYFQLDQYNQAIEEFQQAKLLQEELGDLEAVANTLNNIGLNYKILGYYDKAIEYYRQTIEIDEEFGNSNEIARTFNNIGMIYRAWSKYDSAITYFEKSYSLKKNLNDQAGMSKALNHMGLVFSEWKKFDQAIRILRESLQMEEVLKNESEMAIRLNNLGRVFFYINEFDTALVYFEKSLEIQKRLNDLDQIALAYNNIGKVKLALEQYKEAESYYLSALDIFSEIGMAGEISTVLANLSRIYMASGQSGKALTMLDSSTIISVRINSRRQLQHNYLYYSDIYSERKDFEKSLEYYKKYTADKDSVFTQEILTQLSEFQVKYEKEKDQARILTLEKENLRSINQRNAYMFSGLGIVVIALFIIIYFRQRAKHIKIISEQKIRQLEEEKKLMAAKLLVEGQEEERKRIATELHDGIGVLLSATKMQFSIISDKIPENRELIEKATKMLEQASGDVRKISHNMMPGLLTKLGFFEAVEDLFEHVDDTQGLKAVCTISGNEARLAENKEIMLYRIVQEMVNNTLKYAQANNITLNILVNQGILLLKYTDDGVGFDLAEKLESETIGLKSIQSRVNFLNGRIDIDTEPGKGVKYVLQIPV
jgi:two-component system, NarL family, sensor kinase